MPHVSKTNQVQRKGDKTKNDIAKTYHDAVPRDNLRGAYAGDQNKGPARSQKTHSRIADTHVSGRRRPMDDDRSPKI